MSLRQMKSSYPGVAFGLIIATPLTVPVPSKRQRIARSAARLRGGRVSDSAACSPGWSEVIVPLRSIRCGSISCQPPRIERHDPPAARFMKARSSLQ